MNVSAIANWYGRDGAVIDRVAELLDGCRWIGVPFAGGMGSLAKLRCNQGVASDLHRHVINLARVIADPGHADRLMDQLMAMPLHPDALGMAKKRCFERENHLHDLALWRRPVNGKVDVIPPDVEWAADYFIVSWMSRAGSAGTDSEFGAGGISVRWSAEGGSSSSRWRAAVESIPEWADVLKRWTFEVLDVFDFLEKCYDSVETGLYLDQPFPGAGDKYVHKFTPAMHKRLADRLLRFESTRIVVRFHEDPLIRELYADPRWKVVGLKGRAQTNEERDELLLVLNGATQ